MAIPAPEVRMERFCCSDKIFPILALYAVPISDIREDRGNWLGKQFTADLQRPIPNTIRQTYPLKVKIPGSTRASRGTTILCPRFRAG
jgi:hypothetical protein